MARHNAIPNPRAHVDASGWDGVTRVTSVPVDWPENEQSLAADAAFYAAAEEGGAGMDVLAPVPLPAGCEPGDTVAVQLRVFTDGVSAGDCTLQATLSFFEDDTWPSYIGGADCEIADNVAPPLTGFELYSEECVVPAAATHFGIYVTHNDDAEGGADLAELYVTFVMLEKTVSEFQDFDYRDGDCDGWMWEGDEHDSASVQFAGSMGVEVGLEGTPALSSEVAGTFPVSVGLTGSLTLGTPENELSGEMPVSVGLRGILTLGTPLPATDWEWNEPAIDPELLRTLRVRLATKDGEYTTVDPAELADLRIVKSRKGGVESIEVTLSRDSRIDYGDLDYWTKCEVEYLGRVWPAFVREASLDHSRSAMTRPVRMLGPIAKLSERHRGFRKVYVDSRVSAWRTDQGPQTGANVFEVSA